MSRRRLCHLFSRLSPQPCSMLTTLTLTVMQLAEVHRAGTDKRRHFLILIDVEPCRVSRCLDKRTDHSSSRAHGDMASPGGIDSSIQGPQAAQLPVFSDIRPNTRNNRVLSAYSASVRVRLRATLHDYHWHAARSVSNPGKKSMSALL